MSSTTRLSVRVLSFGLKIVFWLTALGLIIGIPISVATLRASDRPMVVHATVPTAAVTGLPAGVTANEVEVGLPIDHVSTAQIVVLNVLIALGGLVILYGLWQLRQLVQSVRADDPFSEDNVRRLHILGWLLLAAYPAFQYVSGGVNEWILSSGGPPVAGAHVKIDLFSIGAVFGGLALLVLGEVFAHGFRLREDVEATI